MKRYKKIWEISCLLLLCVTAGCADVPKFKTENGISKAESKDKQKVDDILKSHDTDFSDYITKTGDGYILQCNLGTGNQTLNIDAVMDNTGEDDVYPAIVKPAANIINKNRIVELFFENLDIVEEVVENDMQTTVEDESLPEQKQMPCSSRFYLKSLDGNIEFDRFNDAGLYYVNHALYKEYQDILRGTYQEGIEQDISDNYTVDMAWMELKEIMKKIGIEDVRMVSCDSYHNEEGKGVYTIGFTTMVNEIPIENNAGQGIMGQLDPVGYAEIGMEGISEIQLYDLAWELDERIDQSCLDVEQMLQILEKYVLNHDIICSKDIIYDKCQLSYKIKTDDWETATLTPVWRIYISNKKLADEKIVQKLNETNASKEIVIDAVTGEITQ